MAALQEVRPPRGPRFVDHAGKEYGIWHVVGLAGFARGGYACWIVRCRGCGKEIVTRAHTLRTLSGKCRHIRKIPQKRQKPVKCKLCNRAPVAKGLCRSHYQVAWARLNQKKKPGSEVVVRGSLARFIREAAKADGAGISEWLRKKLLQKRDTGRPKTKGKT